MSDRPYYRSNLALVHHLGFGLHADACAPGILEMLEPVRRRNGLVLEIGCGSGALTRHLVRAGHRVIATDASPAMLEQTRAHVTGVRHVQRLTLPDEPLPQADAIVSVGHVLNYLPDEAAIERAMTAIANALLPGGILVIDLCDLTWADARRDARPHVRIEDDWALVTRFSVPTCARFVREITTFVRQQDGSWARDDERHVNVLIGTASVPAWCRRYDIDAETSLSIGTYTLPTGLVAVIGRRPAHA